jgi:hypothetical protein
MNSHHLRAIILKIQDLLSDNDRQRLHFFLGNDVPRRIIDDPSLGGTLNLMQNLFDQDKINERDFTFLINAFDEIHCTDAVQILRGNFNCLLYIYIYIPFLKLFMCRTHETDAEAWTKSIGTKFNIDTTSRSRG